MMVGDLEISLDWRSGNPKPYLTVRGHGLPVALTTSVNRSDLLEIATWLQQVAKRGLYDTYTNSPRLIPEKQEAKS